MTTVPPARNSSMSTPRSAALADHQAVCRQLHSLSRWELKPRGLRERPDGVASGHTLGIQAVDRLVHDEVLRVAEQRCCQPRGVAVPRVIPTCTCPRCSAHVSRHSSTRLSLIPAPCASTQVVAAGACRGKPGGIQHCGDLSCLRVRAVMGCPLILPLKMTWPAVAGQAEHAAHSGGLASLWPETGDLSVRTRRLMSERTLFFP